MGGRPTRAVVLVAVALTALVPLAGAAEAKKKAKKKKLGPVVTRTNVATGSGDGAIVIATAVCPGKSRATGGGFEVPPASPGNFTYVFESLKVGQNAWRVSAQMLDSPPADTTTLTASVYCRKGAAKTSTGSATSATPAGLLLGPTVPATCPGGRKPVAGGWATPPPVAVGVPKNIMVASARSGAAWQSTVISSTAGPSSLTSYVYCAKQKKGLKEAVIPGSPVSTDYAQSTATAACPGSRSVTAGGFSQSGVSLAPPIGFMIPFRSQRLAQGAWVVASVYGGSGAVVSLNSHAYCA